MKTLFKRDSKEKIRVWKIWTEGAKIIQEAGLENGKLVKNEKLATGKNIGKSNESTPAEQAILEMNSTYNGKLTEGYFKTKSEALSEEVILPMLAKSYNDEKHKIDWNSCYIQRKYDGQRCLAIIKDGIITLKSRDGKIIENMDHIISDLSMISENMILDGELFSRELGTFQENMKAIKKNRPGITEKIKYNIYDIISNQNYNDRSIELDHIKDKYSFSSIEFVETNPIFNEKELKSYHQQFISEGFEGSIIRHGNKPYGIDKRCDSLLKYKDFQDIDAEIIDIEPADQRPEWGVPVLKYKNSTFRSGVRMSHEDRKDLLTNKKDYIGKLGNIRFFEWTDEGNPRFPILIGIHEDR